MVYTEYPFTSRYLNLPEGRLHYIDEGVGPVIVMVHGNPTWSYYYRYLVAHLKENHRVIALDHMGCGLSDKPSDYPYCLEQHIENLHRLLDATGVQRFSLVVHDWGGAIGFGYAVQHLERVQSLALMNTAAFRSSRLPWRIGLCRLPVFGEILIRLFNGFAGPACYMAVEKRLSPDVKKCYLAPYNNWQNRVAIARFVQDIPLHAGHPSFAKLVDIENRLSLIRARKIPLLILWGGKDFCFNDEFFHEWRRRFPEAESHYFKDGGHYLLEDKISEILPIVQSFFSR